MLKQAPRVVCFCGCSSTFVLPFKYMLREIDEEGKEGGQGRLEGVWDQKEQQQPQKKEQRQKKKKKMSPVQGT